MTRVFTVMRARREQLGMTQADIATALGVTQPRISAWESGSVLMPRQRQIEVAGMLNVDPDKLLYSATIGLLYAQTPNP